MTMASRTRRSFATLLSAGAVAGIALAGCYTTEEQADTAHPAATAQHSTAGQSYVGRVIIKFKNTALRPDAAEVLAALERDSKARVRYARAVGAGAQLYEFEGLRDQAALETAVKTLAARADVEFAEIDRLMKPLNEKSTR